jgi:hypothetical protein
MIPPQKVGREKLPGTFNYHSFHQTVKTPAKALKTALISKKVVAPFMGRF